MTAVNNEISETECCSSPSVREKKTYSVQEIAEMLQISKSKAYELCKYKLLFFSEKMDDKKIESTENLVFSMLSSVGEVTRTPDLPLRS